VLESNLPPLLTMGNTNRTIHAGTTLTITNSATDPDVPANVLTFSLDPGAPAGAVIGSSSGVFTWTPDQTFVNTTNPVTVRVTDNGSPPLSDAKSFFVTVVASPLITSITVTNGIVTVWWNSIPNQSYLLQKNTDIAGTNWLTVTNIMAVETTVSVHDPVDIESRKFYRVVVVP
jgi:hypothetical protein